MTKWTDKYISRQIAFAESYANVWGSFEAACETTCAERSFILEIQIHGSIQMEYEGKSFIGLQGNDYVKY